METNTAAAANDEALFDKVFEFVANKLNSHNLSAVPVQKVIDRLNIDAANDEAFRARLIGLGFTVRKYAHRLPDNTWEDWASSNFFGISI